MGFNEFRDRSVEGAEKVADKTKDFAKGAIDSASSTVSSLAEKAQDFGEAARSAARQVEEKVGEFSETAQHATDTIQTRAKGAVEEGEKVARQAAQFVQQQPLAGLLVAGVIGFAIGRLVKR